MPVASQAEGFRARVAQRELKVEAEKAIARVAETLQKEVPRVLEEQSAARPFLEPCPSGAARPSASSRVIEVDHRDAKWRITIELAMDPAVQDWLTITDKPPSGGTPVRLRCACRWCIPSCGSFAARSLGDRGAGAGRGSAWALPKSPRETPACPIRHHPAKR